MLLPQAFQEQMCALLGTAEAGALCNVLTETPPPVSVRRHPLKAGDAFAEAERVEWCEAGRYLAERPSFTFDPRLHGGAYYVQEASSMFIEQAYRCIAATTSPHRLLDLCAAPGGKSTLWRSLLPDGSLLVANEPMRPRAQILAENLTKWGHPDVVVTRAFPEEFATLGSFFDVIAADVPCSGEGMFRKDEQAREEWSPEAVVACAERQRSIIADVWPALGEGGYLVYSTCTFNREENEDNVIFICRELGAELVEIPIDPQWNVQGDTTGRSLPVYHFFPHRTRGEGIFLALLRKTSSAPTLREGKSRKKNDRKPSAPIPSSAMLAAWLQSADDYHLFRPSEETIAAVRSALMTDVQRVMATVHCLAAGVLMAEEKGRKLIPQHALALSTVLAPDAFPREALSYEQAIAYLRREAITLSASAPCGYVLVCFEGLPLGFVNNLGARANNLYPNEWRIRKAAP